MCSVALLLRSCKGKGVALVVLGVDVKEDSCCDDNLFASSGMYVLIEPILNIRPRSAIAAITFYNTSPPTDSYAIFAPAG